MSGISAHLFKTVKINSKFPLAITKNKSKLPLTIDFIIILSMKLTCVKSWHQFKIETPNWEISHYRNYEDLNVWTKYQCSDFFRNWVVDDFYYEVDGNLYPKLLFVQ